MFEKNNLGKLTIGIGINSGDAVAGNLGSSDFLDYTVIGDAINTSQRLMLKAGISKILVAKNVYQYIYKKDLLPVDKQLTITVKGKSRPIQCIDYSIVREDNHVGLK